MKIVKWNSFINEAKKKTVVEESYPPFSQSMREIAEITGLNDIDDTLLDFITEMEDSLDIHRDDNFTQYYIMYDNLPVKTLIHKIISEDYNTKCEDVFSQKQLNTPGFQNSHYDDKTISVNKLYSKILNFLITKEKRFLIHTEIGFDIRNHPQLVELIKSSERDIFRCDLNSIGVKNKNGDNYKKFNIVLEIARILNQIKSSMGCEWSLYVNAFEDDYDEDLDDDDYDEDWDGDEYDEDPPRENPTYRGNITFNLFFPVQEGDPNWSEVIPADIRTDLLEFMYSNLNKKQTRRLMEILYRKKD